MSRIGFEKDRTIAVNIAEPDRVFPIFEELLRHVRGDENLDEQIMG